MRKALTQYIEGEQGSGKTELLINLAMGAVGRGRKVLFIFPTKDQADWYGDAFGLGGIHGLRLMDVHGASSFRRVPWPSFNLVLIDDAESFNRYPEEFGDKNVVEIVECMLGRYGCSHHCQVIAAKNSSRQQAADTFSEDCRQFGIAVMAEVKRRMEWLKR